MASTESSLGGFVGSSAGDSRAGGAGRLGPATVLDLKRDDVDVLFLGLGGEDALVVVLIVVIVAVSGKAVGAVVFELRVHL